MFKKGLALEMRTLLTPQIYPDFNTLMNMAILTERARAEEKKEKQAQVHGAQGSTARALPETEKLWTPHVQVPSPHAVPNPVASHRFPGP
jgi:hypothetical protein